MLFIFSTTVLIRHLWQLKTVVFLHWCLICVVLFDEVGYHLKYCHVIFEIEKNIVLTLNVKLQRNLKPIKNPLQS